MENQIEERIRKFKEQIYSIEICYNEADGRWDYIENHDEIAESLGLFEEQLKIQVND